MREATYLYTWPVMVGMSSLSSRITRKSVHLILLTHLSKCGKRKGAYPPTVAIPVPYISHFLTCPRYHEIFFVIDTCQATSMYSKFYSPNILATGSSEVGESSY